MNGKSAACARPELQPLEPRVLLSVLYDANMDNNPGWTLDAGSASYQWEWGQPQGLGGDPASGHTGDNVVGYNLSGPYDGDMAATEYATTPAINCQGYMNVELSFYRWLGVESNLYDHATIQVSDDAANWTDVWTNAGPTIVDTAWEYQDFDISAVADNQPTVYLRWGMGPTDSSVTYAGWNIDDVQVTGDPILSRIEGTKWMDADGDGVRDPGEPGLPGWRIYLDENTNGAWDGGEPYAITDANGEYVIDGVLPGPRVLAEEPQPGWVQTFPHVGGGTLYFSEDSNSSGLYAFDTATGAATHIGISGVTSDTVGLAPSGGADLLYGSKFATLLHINADGSGAADVGGIGNEGLAYDPVTGTLYGALNGDLRTINPADGTMLADLADPGADVEGLACAGGYVYGLVCRGGGGGTPGELLRYDIAADAWSLVGSTGLGSIDYGGLAYDPLRGVLYAKVSGDTALYAIDPLTAQASAIGSTGLTTGGGLAFVTTGGVRIGIDGFEDGDIAEYVEYGGTSIKSVFAAAAHDGAYGLLFDSAGGWIAREDSAAQVAQGDVLSVWVRFAAVADGRAYFGFGASAGGTLSAMLAPNTNELLIQDNSGYGYLDLAAVPQTYAPDTWYRLEVDWGIGGAIVATLYASDGVTPLNSVAANTNVITSGGIAFRGFGVDKHFDTVTRLGAGALVGVDFDEPGGAKPTNWSQFTGGAGTTLTDMIDENGDTTPVDLAISTDGAGSWAWSSSPNPLTLPQHTQSLAGLDRYILETDATWTFQWSDLTPGACYEVYVFGLRAFSSANDVTITGAGLPRTFTQTLTPDDLVVNDELGDSGRALASFAEILRADNAGRIVIEVAYGPGASTPSLGGLAIRQVGPGPRTYLIEVEPDHVYPGMDFGNYPLPGEIRGTKTYDLGADGVLDPAAAGLAGRRIYVDVDDSGSWDAGEPYAFTNASGEYVIQNVPVGPQTVAEEPVAGWVQTAPPAYAAHAVPFGFEDIYLTGTPELVGEDDGCVELTAADLAGFEFDFYGATYSSLYVSSNGLITFGSATGGFDNTDMTDPPSQAAIAPFWDDLRVIGSPDSAVYWEVRGAGDAQRLIIQWHEVEFFAGGGLGTITFQAVLAEAGGMIRFNYLDLDSLDPGAGGAWATAGIKDAGDQGPDRLVVCYNDGPNAYVGTAQSTWIGRSGGRDNIIEVAPATSHGAVDFGNVLPGDANGDGAVDLLDLTIIANNWEQGPRTWRQADFNGDIFVDLLDLTILANNWERVGWAAPAGGEAQQDTPEALEEAQAPARSSLTARPAVPAERAVASEAGGLAAGLPLSTAIDAPSGGDGRLVRRRGSGEARLLEPAGVRRAAPIGQVDLLGTPDLSVLTTEI